MDNVTHRGFTIKLNENDGEIEVRVTRLDGSLIEHENNPDFYDDEDDAITHGITIIDEFLDN